MKILFITTTFARFPGDPQGGVGNCFLDLFLELSKTSDITVVAPLLKDSQKYQKIKLLKIYRVGPIKPAGSLESTVISKDAIKIPQMLINMYREVRRLTKEESFDVINGFFVVPSGLLSAMLPSKNSVKVITCLGTDIHTVSYYPAMPPLFKWIFKKTDGAIYNTPEMRKRLLELKVKTMYYIPTPLNIEEFPLTINTPQSPKFIFVGRLTKKKGVEILLDAFLFVKKNLKDACLTIIGEGPLADYIKYFIKENKMEKSINFLGSQSRKELVKHLQSSYALLLPSFNEGTPSVVLEAMSIGRPIVSTSVGGLKQLTDNEVGILTKVGSSEDFAKGIIKVYKNKYSPIKIHKKIEKFSTKEVAKQYIKTYKELINKRDKNEHRNSN